MGCPADHQLVAMVERSLDPAQFAQIEQHIDTCDHCRKVIAAVLAKTSLAVGTPEPPLSITGKRASLLDLKINDRYVIQSLLGRGGMGTVYLARDVTLDRDVAIKLHHKAGSGSERLHREAMAMAKLAHPNVVTVYEVATVDDDRLFVAMEYVRGETLRGWLAVTPRPWRDVVAMLLEVGRGLAAAHAAGLVHRDFKPENVLVGDDGRPRVGDFGLARVGASRSSDESRPARDADESTSSPLDTPMTVTGALVGTPAYMAPEQLAGDVVDARCDQFAFCVAAWEALFGKRPFAGGTLAAIQESIEKQQLQRPPRTDVPPRVRAVLERGLAVAPADRFDDMPALLSALRRAAAPRTRIRAAVAVAALALLAGGGVLAAGYVGERQQEAACVAAGDEMRGLFGENRREQIRTAFAKTGSPFAAVAFERTADVLVRQTEVLASQAIEVCRGLDEPARVTSARRACLADRRRDVASFIEVLLTADPPLVQRAASAAWAFYDPAPCDDAQTLLARAAVPSTTTPEQATQLRRVKALADAGRYDEAIAAVKPLVAEARATANKSLELDAVTSLGELLFEMEDPEAATQFNEAVTLAESLGRDLDAANAYAVLATHAGTMTRDYTEAHRLIGLARAKLARLGGRSPAEQGELLSIEAQVLLDENRIGEAETAMRSAVSKLEEAYGPDHPKLGSALGTLSQVLRAARKMDESLTVSERTVRVLERALGADHPTVGGARMNLAQAMLVLERLPEARAELLKADEVFARVFGEEHPLRASIAGNLAMVEEAQGDFAASATAARRAVAILEKLQGPDSPDVSGARRDVARALARGDKLDDAVAEQERAIAILDKLGPDGEGRLVSALTDLAQYELARNRPAVALASAERALGLANGRPADANAYELAGAKFVVAQALWESGRDRARARTLAREAVTAGDDPGLREAIEQWLAEHAP